ncbi:hypothetical protein [Adlercreutzia caecimuris]|uniref:hypothetical protein n=1 Tax=Adlercreutzia caecimuris TaxID=671266 RepID=UPI000EE32496|nr:hypothetical protein [Adlercreutzia caecimuris]NBJ66117.1 hypothetical protein [Adlercreutzia caecimuris]
MKSFDDFDGLSDDELRAALAESLDVVVAEDGTADMGAVMAVANYKIMMKTLRAYHEWANS